MGRCNGRVCKDTVNVLAGYHLFFLEGLGIQHKYMKVKGIKDKDESLLYPEEHLFYREENGKYAD